MPWIAEHDGERKSPRQVPEQVDVSCPTCGGRMRVWRRSSDGKARHFKHIGDIGHGNGGGGPGCETVAEHDVHKKWKSLAADRLEHVFEGNISMCSLEHQFKAPHSDKDRRFADAAVIFDEWDEQLGRGVAAEVQHRNNSKDIDAATHDYLEQDIAVVWLYADDFGETHCLLDEIDFRHRAQEAVWPQYAPPTRDNSQDLFEVVAQRVAHDSVSGARATLPPDWCDQQAKQIWRTQRWEQLFRAPHANAAIVRGLVADRSHRIHPPPVLPPEFIDETAKTIWARQPWLALFDPPQTPRYISQAVEKTNENSSLPPPTFPPDITDLVVRQVWEQTPWEDRFYEPNPFLDNLDPTVPQVTADVDFTHWFNQAQLRRWRRTIALKNLLDNAERHRDLGMNAAVRNCFTCGNEAEHYLHYDAFELSGYYCRSCLRECAADLP